MTPYENLNRDSGVVAYDPGVDSITLQFRGGAVYLYTNARTGPANVERMKSLAHAGRGLCTFINRHERVRRSALRVS